MAVWNAERAALDAAAAKRAAGWVNAFGIDLYRAALKNGSLNPGAGAAVSPTSIALALAMARAGAKGTTASQIDAVLHAPDGNALLRGLGSLDQVLASRDRLWEEWGRTHAVALRLANGAFIQRDWAIEEAYLRRLAVDYGSAAWRVDFASDPDRARRTVNAWVKSKTRGRIPELLDSLDRATRLVLVNAVYLKAEWEQWFWEDATKPETFRRLDGTTVKVPTMHRIAGGGCLSPPIAYAAGTGWRAIDLRTEAPEGESPLSMVVVVPDDLRAFERTLTAARLQAIAARLDRERQMFDTGTLPKGARCTNPMGCYPYDVSLHMPKFTVESKASLVGALSSLGMPLAFGSGADFSGIHAPAGATDRLYITDAIHQANVSIDERGIEAAAATALGEGCAGPGPLRRHELKVNRPFMFVIRDVATGAFLFVGRVVDPGAPR
jgi:serpin B